MTKHWLALLPEAGRVVKNRAHEMEIKYLKLERLKQELKQFEEEIQEFEDSYLKWALTDWTETEILTAKQNANALNE